MSSYIYWTLRFNDLLTMNFPPFEQVRTFYLAFETATQTETWQAALQCNRVISQARRSERQRYTVVLRHVLERRHVPNVNTKAELMAERFFRGLLWDRPARMQSSQPDTRVMTSEWYSTLLAPQPACWMTSSMLLP